MSLVADSRPTPESIAAGPFWPAISTQEVREALRSDGSVAGPRLRSAIEAALSTLNYDTAVWQADQLMQGITRLQDIQRPELPGLFMRAISALVGAEIAERFRRPDSTPAGKDAADTLGSTISAYRRDARHAIADIKQTPRCTVDLI